MQFLSSFIDEFLKIMMNIWSFLPYFISILSVFVAIYVLSALFLLKRQLHKVLTGDQFNKVVQIRFSTVMDNFRNEMKSERASQVKQMDDLTNTLVYFNERLTDDITIRHEITGHHVKRIKELENEVTKLKKISEKLRKKLNEKEDNEK